MPLRLTLQSEFTDKERIERSSTTTAQARCSTRTIEEEEELHSNTNTQGNQQDSVTQVHAGEPAPRPREGSSRKSGP